MGSALDRRAACAALALTLASGCASSIMRSGPPNTEDYTGYGVTFRYADSMAVQFTKPTDIIDAVVLSADDAVAYVIVGESPLLDAAQLGDVMWASIRKSLFRNAIVDEEAATTVERTIAGHAIAGRRLVGRLGVELLIAEIYAVDLGGTPVALVFTYPAPAAEQDAPMFDLIASSLARASQ
jgi:hypothetical protein